MLEILPNKFIVYIDGNIELIENTAGSDVIFDTFHRIGGDHRDGTGGPNFHGKIDDIRIYDKTLGESEIKSLYEIERPNHFPETISGLALWLDANNVDGKQNTTLSNSSDINEWKDLSGNNYDAIALKEIQLFRLMLKIVKFISQGLIHLN